MGHRALNKHLAVKISKTVNIYVDAGHFSCSSIGDINIGSCFCGPFILPYYSLAGNFLLFRTTSLHFIL